MNQLENKKLTKFGKYFSEKNFKDKILNVAKKAGIKVVYAALTLYFALMDKNFPNKERMLILGALGYFILPVDMIPDAIPFLGYADDLMALLFALRKVYSHITPEIQEKAKAKVIALFGEVDEKEFEL